MVEVKVLQIYHTDNQSVAMAMGYNDVYKRLDLHSWLNNLVMKIDTHAE